MMYVHDGHHHTAAARPRHRGAPWRGRQDVLVPSERCPRRVVPRPVRGRECFLRGGHGAEAPRRDTRASGASPELTEGRSGSLFRLKPYAANGCCRRDDRRTRAACRSATAPRHSNFLFLLTPPEAVSCRWPECPVTVIRCISPGARRPDG